MRTLEEKKLLGTSAAALFFRKTDRSLPEHQLDCCKLVFFTRASGSVFVKDRSYPLQKGAVLLLAPFTPHRIRLTGEGEYADLLLSARLLSSPRFGQLCRLLDTGLPLGEESSPLRYPDAEGQKWLLLWLERMSLWKGDRGEDSESLLYAELAALLVLLSRCSRALSPDGEEPLYEIKEYIDKNFTRRITLEELARRYSYSPFHLSRFFKEQEGKGFKEYLLERRLDYACRLLVDGRWGVNDVCRMAGFSGRSFFYRYFRRKKGMTPDAFRKKHFPKY